MTKLARFLIVGVIAAEVGGGLFVLGLWHFYSVGFSSAHGTLVVATALAVVGALAGLAGWAIVSFAQRSRQMSETGRKRSQPSRQKADI